MSELDAYPFELGRLPEAQGGAFIVRFPAIPGCLGVGATEDEALSDGRDALKACLDAFKAVDRPAPDPASKA